MALPIHLFRRFCSRMYRLATTAVGCIVHPQHTAETKLPMEQSQKVWSLDHGYSDHWRQTAVAVSSLAANQGAHSVQDGAPGIQDTARFVSTIPGGSTTTVTTDEIAAVLRRSTVDCTTNTNCTGDSRFLCGCAHCMERFAVQHPVVQLAVDFQTPSKNSLFYCRVCVT